MFSFSIRCGLIILFLVIVTRVAAQTVLDSADEVSTKSGRAAALVAESGDTSWKKGHVLREGVAGAKSLGSWQSLFRRQYDNPRIVEDFLAEVRAKPGSQRTIVLESTLSWGCACPTWVFPFHEDMRELQHVMVLPAATLRQDPTDFATPERTYQMTGRFTGEVLTGLEWVKQRKARPPNFPNESPDNPALKEYWSAPGLVFIVESWCFEKNGRSHEAKWLRKRGATRCPE